MSEEISGDTVEVKSKAAMRAPLDMADLYHLRHACDGAAILSRCNS